MSNDSGGGEIEETQAERALAEVSANKWVDYQEKFVPLENQYMQSVEDLNSDATKQRVRSNAASKVYGQASGQNFGLSKSTFGAGLDPTSGRFKTKSNALQRAIQKTADNAANNSEFAAENSYIQGMGNIVAMGNNQETAAMNSMSHIANTASGEAINDARMDFQDYQSDQKVGATVFGAGAAYGLNGGFDDMNKSLNQSAVRSGLKYGTISDSQQSGSLADQENGFGYF